MPVVRPPARLLIDTSCAIGLNECAGREDLFDKLIEAGFELAFPPAVWEELGPQGTALRQHPHVQGFEPPAESLAALATTYPLLGKGELAVLAQATIGSGVCVLDDKRARNAAKENDLPYTGTLGLLDALHSAALLTGSEVSAITECLASHGFFLPNPI